MFLFFYKNVKVTFNKNSGHQKHMQVVIGLLVGRSVVWLVSRPRFLCLSPLSPPSTADNTMNKRPAGCWPKQNCLSLAIGHCLAFLSTYQTGYV